MEAIVGIFVLFLFGTPLLAIVLLLLFVALKFIQLLCYALAWLCAGLGKLCGFLFEGKQPLSPTQEDSSIYSVNTWSDGETYGN
jgi:hypothetical protein